MLCGMFSYVEYKSDGLILYALNRGRLITLSYAWYNEGCSEKFRSSTINEGSYYS